MQWYMHCCKARHDKDVCRYVEQQAAKGWPELMGTAYLASAPPTGNRELVKRIVKAMPLKSIAITWGATIISAALHVAMCFHMPDLPGYALCPRR